VNAAIDQPLDASTILDATLGPETIYGVFCTEPIALEPVRAALGASGKLPSMSNCEVDELVLHKKAL
jgi:hypothetical protein